MAELWDLIPDEPSIQERFERFDAEHPDVYQLFKEFAFKLREAGNERGSARMILERIRWEIKTTSRAKNNPDGYKLNDHYIPRYARKLIDECPEFEKFFELRALQRE